MEADTPPASKEPGGGGKSGSAQTGSSPTPPSAPLENGHSQPEPPASAKAVSNAPDVSSLPEELRGAAPFADFLLCAIESRASSLQTWRQRQTLRRAAHLLACGAECDSGDEMERQLFGATPEALSAVDGSHSNWPPGAGFRPLLRCRVPANARRRERTTAWRKNKEMEDLGTERY